MSSVPTHSTNPYRYDLYGLHVDSDLALAGATRSHHDRPVELRLRTHDPVPVPHAIPDGEVLALWRSPEQFWHGVFRTPRGVLFRVPEVGDFTLLDGARGDVEIAPASDEQLGLVGVLASGALFAVRFELEGIPILHAGAVVVGERAVAIVGSSGRGKSTTSALLCRAGHRLVTDDLLRLRFDDEVVTCFRGTTSLRLRDKARALVEQLGGADATSADGRLLLRPTPSDAGELPLAALVFPVPTRDGGSEVEARRLTTAEAFDELLASPRFLGWEAPSVLTRLFTTASQLAERLTAYEVRVPWNEQFDDELVARLSACIGEIERDTSW